MMNSYKKYTGLEIFLVYLILCIAVVIALFPIFWVFQTSVKSPKEQLAIPPVWFPQFFTFSNYLNLFHNIDLSRTIFNSIFVTTFSVLLALTIGTVAAYAISRFSVGGETLPFFILTIRMIPPVALILPFFLLARSFRVHDTYITLIMVYTFFILPIVIWMMMGFFSELPTEIEEAAMIDGCSQIGMLFRIVLPLTAPGLAATAILCSILCWNEFIFALVLTSTRARTLPVLVNCFVTQRSVDYGTMCATGMVMVTPMVVFGLLIQKHLVRGLTMGAVKG